MPASKGAKQLLLTGKPRDSPNHPGARTWGFSSCMSPSLCHSRQVRSDSALSPYILYPILILLCLDPRGWRSTWQRAKPTGKPSATRAKGNGNNPRGEEWEVSILSKAGPGVSLKTLPESPHLHTPRTITEHVLSFEIHSPKYLRCADCVSSLEASEEKFRGRRTGPRSEI